MNMLTQIEALNADLTMLKEREATIGELRVLTIKDLTIPLPDIIDLYELTQIYLTYMPLDSDIFTLTDRIVFCNILVNNVKTPIGQLLLSEIAINEISTIAYVKNQYSSAALSYFKKHISIKKEHAFRSFNEMCDDIESNVYDDCIIPLENTSNGKLMSFYSIIDRLDMKISTICDIENQNGDQITRYALLRRSVTIPENILNSYLEFSFTVSEHFGIKDLVNVASLMDLELYRIDSIPLQYDESAFVYYPVLQGTIKNLLMFLVFLKLNLTPYNLIGLYDRI